MARASRPPASGKAPDELRAHAVGVLREHADRRPGEAGDLVRDGDEHRVIRMLLRVVAQEDRGALAAAEALRDGARLVGHGDAGRRPSPTSPSRGLPALPATAFATDASAAASARGPRHEAMGHRHQEIVVRDVHHVHGEPLLRALAQAVGEQRLLLADRGAHEEHGLQRAHLRDLHAEPRGAGEAGARSPSARKW